VVVLSSLQVLAALAAVAEVIKAQGGQETDTEYFAALVRIFLFVAL